MSFESRINSTFRRTERVEKDAYPESEETFEERIERSREKAKEILDHVNMVRIAEDLLQNHPEVNVDNPPSEEELQSITQDYDAAVIIAICREIKERKNKLN